tara:strand:- start:39733 stop:40176 length:444 start_codon:yes stop_codon:yes gene_type:complete
MCIILKRTEASIANEDIICYKLLDNYNGRLKSAFYTDHLYELNKLQPVVKIKESNDICCFSNIDNDFLNKNYPNWQLNGNMSQYDLMCIGRGYHSIDTLEYAEKELIISRFDKTVIVECTIPQGSLYYKGPTGLLVSNQIIVNKIIK